MIDKEQKFIDIHPILDYAIVDNYLEICKKAAEKMNKVFGWDITFDKSEIVKEDGETND